MRRVTYKNCRGKSLWYEHYEKDECIREIMPLAESIFGTKEHWWCFITIEEFPFPDPTWRLVMLPGDVDQWHIDWVAREEGTDTSTDFHDRDELAPLWEILAEDGVEEVILCDTTWWPDRDPEHPQAVVFPPSREAAMGVHFSTGFPHYLFDRTRRWGVVGMVEDDCLLGGEPAFMARFIEKAGGLAELQRRFDAHAKGCELNPYKAPEYWRAVYDIVGWPLPVAGPSTPQQSTPQQRRSNPGRADVAPPRRSLFPYLYNVYWRARGLLRR